MTYTAREVEEALETYTYVYTSVYSQKSVDVEFSWHGVEEIFEDHGPLKTNVGTVSLVEVGGTTDYDSSGSLFAVVKVEDTGQLFRKDGWYQSHCGSEWDGKFYEVQAKEKVITVYE